MCAWVSREPEEALKPDHLLVKLSHEIFLCNLFVGQGYR